MSHLKVGDAPEYKCNVCPYVGPFPVVETWEYNDTGWVQFECPACHERANYPAFWPDLHGEDWSDESEDQLDRLFERALDRLSVSDTSTKEEGE